MDLPAWVGEYTLQRATPVESRLLIALFLYGRPVVGPNGERRVYWKASNDELLTGAKCSRQGMMDARRALATDGVIAVHKSARHKSASAISAPVERPVWGLIDEVDAEAWGLTIRPHVESESASRGLTIRPHAESKSAHHDDDLQISPLPSEVGGSSSSSPFVARELVDRLGELGITDPAAFLRRFGAEHARRALELYDEATARSHVRNPAGLLTHLVTSPLSDLKPSSVDDDFESRKRRYTGGRLGHILRYR